MKPAAACLAVALGIATPGLSFAQASGSAQATHQSEADELRARTAAFSSAIVAASRSGWSSEAVARIADFYAMDTVIFPPRGAPMRGRAAQVAYWTRSPDRRILSHSAVAERIDVSGNLATEWGTLTMTSQQGDAAPAQGTATYISIWVRGEDRIWRKLMDTWW